MMAARESRTIVLLAIALLTLFAAVRCEVCSAFDPFFCACSLSEPTEFKILRMCQFARRNRVICTPCPIDLQSQVNCTACPGNTCPICSKYTFGRDLSSFSSARYEWLFTFSPYAGIAISWNTLRRQNGTSNAHSKMGWIQSSKEAQAAARFRIKNMYNKGKTSYLGKLTENNGQSDVVADLQPSISVEAQMISAAESGKTNESKRSNTRSKSIALPAVRPKKSEGLKTISETSGFNGFGTKGFGPMRPPFDPCVPRHSPKSGRLYLRRSRFHPRERETILELLSKTGIFPNPKDASSFHQLADQFLLAYQVTDPYYIGMKIQHRSASDLVRETRLEFRFDPVSSVAAVCVNGEHALSAAIDKRYRIPDMLHRLRKHYQLIVRKLNGSRRVSQSGPAIPVGDKQTPNERINVDVMGVNPGLNKTAHVPDKTTAGPGVMSESQDNGTEIHQGHPNRGIENEQVHNSDKSGKEEDVSTNVIPKEALRNRRQASAMPQNSWCNVPNTARDGDLRCTIWSYKKFCTLYCHEGCLYAGQPTAQLTCDIRRGIWEPALEPCRCGDSPSGNYLAGEQTDYGVLPQGGEDHFEEEDYYDNGDYLPVEDNYDGQDYGILPSDVSNQEHNDYGNEPGTLPPEGEVLPNKEYYDDREDYPHPEEETAH